MQDNSGGQGEDHYEPQTFELISHGNDLEDILCLVYDDSGDSHQRRVLALPHYIRFSCKETRKRYISRLEMASNTHQ